MSPTFAKGTLRVVTPPTYAARRAGSPRGLPKPAEAPAAASKQALLTALDAGGLHRVESVDLTPQRLAAKGRSRAAGARPRRAGTVEIEVDVGRDEDAVVLLEHAGVYSWHLPTDRRRRARGPGGAPHPRRFELDIGRPVRGRPAARRDRGILGGAVQGAAQALVFTFAAPLAATRAMERMEAHVRPGLVHLAGVDVARWRRVGSLAELPLPADRPARVLLLVHGTFSSTVGGFGALSVGETGRDFLRDAIRAYDAVIGFDHRTLSVDPRQNAEDLVRRLGTRRPGAELVVDVVTHSRGGLVTRSLVEQVLPSSGWPGRVEHIVFVAATNAGTHLADPKRWADLLDLETNLAMVSAGVLARVPGGASVGAVVGGVVTGVAALVKYLVSYAAEGADVPGLAAMVPGGAFVREINRLQPGQPGPGTSWFVVSSDFHVTVSRNHHRPPELPRALAVELAEGFVDRLLRGANDLVVDTASMSAIGLPNGGFVAGSLALGANDVVHHHNYFVQPRVIEAIAGWLPVGPVADGGRATGAPAEPSADHPDVPDGPPDGGEPSGPSRALPGAAPERRVARASRGAERTAAPPATRARLAAEMPGHVVVGTDFTVRVRLSRGALVATAGSAHAEATVLIDEQRPISVQVVGKTNVAIAGTGSDVFALPPGGGVSELPFSARAMVAGRCVVDVVVKQGAVPVARMRLEGAAVGRDEGAVPQGSAVAETHPGTDAPELEGLPCIDVYERELTANRVCYQYAVRLEPGRPVLHFESRPIRDRERKIGGILDDVAAVWRNTGAQPRERERTLQDIGATMFEELFPEDLRTLLWRKRAKVRDLILYADEPFVPWELVHLKPPTGPRPKTPLFLAQCGLVRWQPGAVPPRQLQVRRGRARSLVPAYKDPRFALTEPVHEQAFLARRFHATKVTATPTGVRALLRSGRFDLLHFSGHGAADPDDILDAKLLLQGQKRAGTVEPQYLAATAVSQNAARTGAGEPGPLVVLNACQLGQAGELLTTVGGFAKAFLDAGASAFVSCLWSVREEPSRVFVEKLYDELLAGAEVSVAATRARAAARTAGDPTWLAFVVYARPDAVLVTS